MLRRILTVFGVLELLFPRRIIAFGERLAFSNPGEHELQPWIVPAARAEALVYLALFRRDVPFHPVARVVVGILGIPALARPRAFVGVALALAYQDPERIELKPWVAPVTRILGLLYLLVGLRWFTSREPVE